jgi:hypothetical protein
VVDVDFVTASFARFQRRNRENLLADLAVVGVILSTPTKVTANTVVVLAALINMAFS